VEFSETTLEAARAQADDFRRAHRVATARPSARTWDDLVAALDDDFDTPRALAILHDWRAAGQVELLARGLDVFGLAIDDTAAEVPPAARRLAEERQAARARRDYAEADRLRADLDRLGWEVQDAPAGFRLIPKSR
jgi:cysteinyl-tRNA synthetase